MRPPEFTGGNYLEPGEILTEHHYASMRPPEFTGGNINCRTRMVPAGDELQ